MSINIFNMDILPTDITNIIFSYKVEIETYLNKKKLLNQLLNTYEYNYINEFESVLVNKINKKVKDYFLKKYNFIFLLEIIYVKTYQDYEKEYTISVYDEWRMSRIPFRRGNIFRCYGDKNYYRNITDIKIYFNKEYNYNIKSNIHIELVHRNYI